jgi:hypothetical protein
MWVKCLHFIISFTLIPYYGLQCATDTAAAEAAERDLKWEKLGEETPNNQYNESIGLNTKNSKPLISNI